MESRIVELGEGRSLHAVQAGEGPDLVLVHGALTTHRDWLAGPFPALARRFRVTAVDRPGHGLSRRPRFEGTPRDQAAQIRRGLDALGVARAVIVGHSMGGMVALALAEQFPESVAALVLVAPIAFPEARPLEHGLFAPRSAPLLGPLFSALAEATFDRPLLEVVHRQMFAPQPVPPEWKADYPYGEILTADAMVREGEDAASILPFAPTGTIAYADLRTPVHILAGTADRVVDPARHALPLSRLVPRARLTQIEGAGHMAHHVAPEELLAAIGKAAEFAAAV